MKPLTSSQYIQKGASVCPVCRSTNICADTVEVDSDGNGGTSNVACSDCGSYWVDIWRIVQYDNLNEGMTKEELQAVEKKVKALYEDDKA